MIQGNYKSEHAMCSGWNCCYPKRGLTSKVCQISQLLGVKQQTKWKRDKKINYKKKAQPCLAKFGYIIYLKMFQETRISTILCMPTA